MEAEEILDSLEIKGQTLRPTLSARILMQRQIHSGGAAKRLKEHFELQTHLEGPFGPLGLALLVPLFEVTVPVFFALHPVGLKQIQKANLAK